MSYSMELTEFQLLTPGLYSGDPIIIRVNFRVVATGFWRYAGWMTRIRGIIDGQTASIPGMFDIGNHGGRDNREIVFTGVMPPGKHLSGILYFDGNYAPGVYPWTEFAQRDIVIPNLDDVVPPIPDGPPPAVCTEGQTRCEGYDLMVCKNSMWVVKEYDSSECGYMPPPLCAEGDEVCVGYDLRVCSGGRWVLKEQNSAKCGYVPPTPPPTPPDDIPGWFERNKVLIIAVAAAILVVAIIVMIKKPQYRPPIKVRSPIVRR